MLELVVGCLGSVSRGWYSSPLFDQCGSLDIFDWILVWL